MKKFLMVAAVAAFTMSFVACNQKPAESTETPVVESAQVEEAVIETPTDSAAVVAVEEVVAPAAQ